jgi:hypothetical protein
MRGLDADPFPVTLFIPGCPLTVDDFVPGGNAMAGDVRRSLLNAATVLTHVGEDGLDHDESGPTSGRCLGPPDTGLRNRVHCLDHDVVANLEEFIPFLAYDVEIRRVLFSTNAIESLHSRYRRAITVRGHFPTEQAALKTLYLVTRGMDPKGTGQARWVTRWKPALNAFAVTFADRMPAAETL